MPTRYAAGVLTSRSSLECHLYMELHPCECGETRGPQRHKLVSGDEGLVAAYEDACPRCGRMRRFDFLLDPELVPADWFGGANVSSIVDAGQ
jgi:hypothetical protein